MNCFSRKKGDSATKRTAFENNQCLQESIKHRIVLCNSFIGLDKPCLLPPNVTMTGPLLESSSVLLDKLKEQDKEVFDFLEGAIGTDKSAVLINMGVEFAWQQWAVDLVYKCLTTLSRLQTVKVVWALPEDGPQLPADFDKSKFLVKPWIMQASILAHPAIKAAMVQGGFGGTLEAVNAAKPLLCWPCNDEQVANASLLEEANVGIVLGGGAIAQFDGKSMATFVEPVFTEDQFKNGMRALLNDQVFETSMQRLRCIGRVAGGTSKAVKVIEKAFLHFSVGHLQNRESIEMLEPSHLVDLSFYQTQSHLNWVECSFIFYLFIPAVFLWLLIGGFEGLLNLRG